MSTALIERILTVANERLSLDQIPQDLENEERYLVNIADNIERDIIAERNKGFLSCLYSGSFSWKIRDDESKSTLLHHAVSSNAPIKLLKLFIIAILKEIQQHQPDEKKLNEEFAEIINARNVVQHTALRMALMGLNPVFNNLDAKLRYIFWQERQFEEAVKQDEEVIEMKALTDETTSLLSKV